MQLIATAASNTREDRADRPATNAIDLACGHAYRATQRLPSVNRIIRSI
jgi:hypothetical protein